VSTAWDCTTTYRKEQPVTTYRDRLIAGIHDAPGTEADKTVADLKAALRALDQPVSGSKAELEQRLADAQQNA
jgi:predicted nucleic acid-binding Zn ribbon protein